MNTDPLPIVRHTDALAELAAGIRAEHTAALSAVKKGVEHAKAAGELLNRAKAMCGHGQWLPWLATNCPDLGVRQAQKYMRLAARWHELPPSANANSGAHLPINDALAILSASEPSTLPTGGEGIEELEAKAAAVEEANRLLKQVQTDGLDGLSPDAIQQVYKAAEEMIAAATAIRVDSLTAIGEILNLQAGKKSPATIVPPAGQSESMESLPELPAAAEEILATGRGCVGCLPGEIGNETLSIAVEIVPAANRPGFVYISVVIGDEQTATRKPVDYNYAAYMLEHFGASLPIQKLLAWVESGEATATNPWLEPAWAAEPAWK